jgi:hypothetical protein
LSARDAAAVLLLGGAYFAWRGMADAGSLDAGALGLDPDYISLDFNTGFDAYGVSDVTDPNMPYGYQPFVIDPDVAKQSLSFLNNNPIDLRPGGGTFVGQIGTMSYPGKGQFLQFETVEDGYRAAGITLINYATVYGATTLRQIINTAAPAADQNDPDAYLAVVAADTGLDPDTPLNLKSDPAALTAILQSMTKVESGGVQPYPLATIQEGVRRALAHFGL